ncbi:hypothetical protein [Crocosphaera watsonii]|uniref:hypothetical protein n=1 Tax=Crocosphaera watsonii TaxID=263511 RepID=UPI001110B966|nr:hypothetical protein [Crocosphaera watsonii]
MIFSASLLSSATSEVSGVSIAEVSEVSRYCSVSGVSIAEVSGVSRDCSVSGVSIGRSFRSF